MAVALKSLQQSRGCHLFAQVMMSIHGESVVAVDQGDEGQCLGQRREFQLLKVRESDEKKSE